MSGRGSSPPSGLAAKLESPCTYGRTRGSPPAATEIAPPDAYVPTVSTPASPIPVAAAVQNAVRAMRGTDVVSVRVGSPPADIRSRRHFVIPALYVTVRIPALKSAAMTKALWEAQLVEGAIVEQAGSSHSLADDMGYVEFDGLLPGGKLVRSLGGGIGNIARGQQFAGAAYSLAAVNRTMGAAARAYGVTVDSVRIFHALGDAPAVVVTAPDFSRLASQFDAFRTSIFGAKPCYRADYLEIVAPDGKPYFSGGASFVTGTGGTWVDPSVSGELGLAHG